jgi:hypothetical protein
MTALFKAFSCSLRIHVDYANLQAFTIVNQRRLRQYAPHEQAAQQGDSGEQTHLANGDPLFLFPCRLLLSVFDTSSNGRERQVNQEEVIQRHTSQTTAFLGMLLAAAAALRQSKEITMKYQRLLVSALFVCTLVFGSHSAWAATQSRLAPD